MSDQEQQSTSAAKGKAVAQETASSSNPNAAFEESSTESQPANPEQSQSGNQQQAESSQFSPSSSDPAPSSSSPTQTEQASKCANCPKAAPQKACPKCQSTFYCSRECMKAHWKVHKKICASAAQAFLQNKDLKMASRSAPKKDSHRGGLQKWQFDT